MLGCIAKACAWRAGSTVPSMSPSSRHWLTRLPHLKRLKLLPDAERHAAVELFRGDIAMHSLVACRDDRPAENYQVSFDGQAWKG